ncbi:hypothetical protein DCCM_2732 [Desulfocucumis palustris]|uniref:Uncharacterized protein n=1 Tax=Desulfocucumis palustris TaxID=1898651 RepID=A0A2L2XHC4_9FIRM|nr:hypothetical protein DCCM_2732 [Desulfocucumis palustris]
MEARWLFGLVTMIEIQVNMFMILKNILFVFMVNILLQ